MKGEAVGCEAGRVRQLTVREGGREWWWWWLRVRLREADENGIGRECGRSGECGQRERETEREE